MWKSLLDLGRVFCPDLELPNSQSVKSKNDQKTTKTNSTGGGASQTTTSADTNKGSNPKPKEATVVNRIRGTL